MMQGIAKDRQEEGRGRCGNCDQSLAGPWCHACGQRASTTRLGFRSMSADLLERIGQVESGMVRTLFGLVRDPRATIQAYLDGRRRQFAHPFTLLLVVATLSLLSTHLMGERFWLEFDRVIAQQASALHDQPQRLQRFLAFYRFLFAALPYWMLLFTLPLAVLMRAMFPRTPLRIAEYWVAALYAAGLAILIDVPMSLLLHAGAVPVQYQMMATSLLLMAVQARVLARFLSRGWTGILRVLVAVVLSYALAGSLQNVAAYLYAYG
jgi:hypothetical protein